MNIDIINPRKDLFKYFIDYYKEEYNVDGTEENLSNKINKKLIS